MKSNTRKKILALFAAGALAVAGAAWAYTGLTLTGNTNDDALDVSATARPSNGVFNAINGYGLVDGSIAGGGEDIVLKLNSTTGQTLEIVPTLDNSGATLAANRRLAEGAGALQFVVNDGATNNGTVLVRASNGDAPTNSPANYYTLYSGGTFVDGGTLAITNNNSLGQNWVSILGRTTAENRVGATLQTFGTTIVALGANDPAGATTVQPLYLTYRTPNGIKLATVDVGKTGGVEQTLRLLQGVDEATSTPAAAGNIGAADTPAAIAPLGTAAAHLRTGFDADNGMVGRFVKTGAGKLVVTEYIPNGQTLSTTTFGTMQGMAHTGGTVVNAGTMQVDGFNANVYANHFTGFVGSMWSSYTPTEAYNNLMDGGGRVPVYFANTQDANGNNNNPFRLNGGTVIVDRAQMFSDFNTAKDTSFVANEYTLNNENFRPVINVMLMRRPSEAAGKMSGSFDLVLNSYRNEADDSTNLREPQSANYVNADVLGNGQATLTVSNKENSIYGQTFVNNGVLAIGGANSIGSGNLTVGTATATPVRGLQTQQKAVFLGLDNATFTNKTYVNGRPNAKLVPQAAPASPITPAAGRTIGGINTTQVGALAAATGYTTAYADVTINGAIEINPQAVQETVYNVTGAGEVNWLNEATYPTWGGTVVFGGENAKYDIGGSTNVLTQIFVSRGTLQLNSLPVSDDNINNKFANVMLRETSTLSLAEGVSKFARYFDVQIDDDSRIRLIPTASTIYDSRAAAVVGTSLFEVRTFDATWLGSGQNNKDRRLAIQLDLKNFPNGLKKGQWIKAVSAQDAVKWNNIHYLRDNSDTFYEDYAKVRVGLLNITDTTTKVVAHVDENPYVIYLEVVEDTNIPTPGPTTDIFNLTATGGTNSINAAVTYMASDLTTPVASQDITFSIQKGTETPITKTAVTDANGKASVSFTGLAAGTYSVVATDGTNNSAAKSVVVTGTTPISSGSSSGCDAGFGAFALLAMAGGALVLRKKD